MLKKMNQLNFPRYVIKLDILRNTNQTTLERLHYTLSGLSSMARLQMFIEKVMPIK